MSSADVDQWLHAALAHHQAGRLPQAEALYRQVLNARPQHDAALHLLGVLSAQTRRFDAAIELLQRAAAIDPNNPAYHSNLANAYIQAGRFDAAAASARHAVTLNANYAEGHFNLGTALFRKGERDHAISSLRRAAALKPDFAKARRDLGVALRERGDLDEAIACFEAALALQPNDFETRGHLGLALFRRGKLDEAIAAFERALALKPDFADALGNLGTVLYETRDLDRAIASFRGLVALLPEHAEAHWNLALALLLRGDLAEGWAEHEWRWRCANFATLRRGFTAPQWDGSPLAGRTILLHAEQGFGDAIQFVRYAPLVAERGGNVVIECQPELVRLVQASFPQFACIARGTALPACDVHCPLMSLPYAFGTRLDTIPAPTPYLRADEAAVARWREKLGVPATRTIGVAWAGSKAHKNDANRSMPPALLAPLANVPGVRLVSLQKGAIAPPELRVLDWTAELNDFADTAALIANLDLVISVDTVIAHLAGALGKPVWTLLPFAPDWRWLLNRDDSPWYPTMRLLRQPAIGDWTGIVGLAALLSPGTPGERRAARPACPVP